MTRARQLAIAYLAVAKADHYMVGIVDPDVTTQELERAYQHLVDTQNSHNCKNPEGEVNVEWEEEGQIIDLALDLVENAIRERRG